MSELRTSNSIIHQLSPEISNKIAAGEVIQRPASVVKELLDNAIDAGADDITVIIGNAGRTLIQVIDNGCGMSRDDLPYALSDMQHQKLTQLMICFRSKQWVLEAKLWLRLHL